jgi:hypothetical protein
MNESSSDTLTELERARKHACRLTPDRALNTLSDARAFLDARGILTRTSDCALPSLFDACHEPSARPDTHGFGSWPATKWIWSFQLSGEGGALVTKVHKGRTLYMSQAATAAFDALCRRAAETATGDEARLVRHLHEAGPSMNPDVELELGWDKARVKRARTRLERVGAVVSDGLVFGASIEEWSYGPMRLWSQAVPCPVPSADPYGKVVVVGVRAAVLAPETEVVRWFSWPIPEGTVGRLVSEGRLQRPAPGWLTAPTRTEGRPEKARKSSFSTRL